MIHKLAVCLIDVVVPKVAKKESLDDDIAVSDVEPTSQSTNAKVTNTTLSMHLESKYNTGGR